MLTAGMLLLALAPSTVIAAETQSNNASCHAAITDLNARFSTVRSKNLGKFREDSGLLVHTTHGPKTPDSTGGGFLDFTALENVLKFEAGAGISHADKTCGSYISQKPNGIYLPWCGSNRNPSKANPQTKKTDDSSSWSFLRLDTLINDRPVKVYDEVACSAESNKRYGLIFSTDYLNHNDNLGCMYPLDGDTGGRVARGCGKSVNSAINTAKAQGACKTVVMPQKIKTDINYRTAFQTLLTENNSGFQSYAGSLVCSLESDQFDIWSVARRHIDLSKTDWPINEFVLFNWETYSTKALTDNRFLLGVYYLTGCDRTSTDGDAAVAQKIADLYKAWSGGVEIPVVNLSNATLRHADKRLREAPFSCP